MCVFQRVILAREALVDRKFAILGRGHGGRRPDDCAFELDLAKLALWETTLQAAHLSEVGVEVSA
jgi:hypothetical protein